MCIRDRVYSDGYAYQNPSTNLANALLDISCTNNTTIEQKYLEIRHTQTEVDFMHSLIHRRLKNTKINVPADYITTCREGMKSPAKHKVEYLDHIFF